MPENIKAFVFDCDGVLYIGSKVVEGALETVQILSGSGFQVFFLTNNSGKNQMQVVLKLDDLGFEAGIANTYCCSSAIAHYLTEKKIGPVYVIGTDGLKSDLMLKGIEMKDSVTVSSVVIGLDPNFTYKKITKALQAIKKGARLIVANLDPSYPVEGGKLLPGCGAMVGAIVGATGHKPDFMVGKPNTYMLELICKEHGLIPAEICVVGDMLESDIQMAVNFGCESILYDPNNVYLAPDHYRVENLRDILSLTKRREG